MDREMASRTYKAKRKNWRELPKEKWWVEGAIFEGKENSYIITNVKVTDKWEDSEIGADVIGYLVDPETVCQYTRLTDKNGRKIFEEDILFCSELGNIKVQFKNSEFKAIGITHDMFSALLSSVYKHCEIIGNIFDNPELIGE